MDQRVQTKDSGRGRHWWRADAPDKTITCLVMLQPGDDCPSCAQGRLAYNGLFQLACDHCGEVADPGAFT